MKDPLDTRADIYTLLGCPENCNRGAAMQGFARQFRNPKKGKELTEAKDIITRPDKRAQYDVFRYAFSSDVSEATALEVPAIPMDQLMSIEDVKLDPSWLNPAAVLAAMPVGAEDIVPPAIASLDLTDCEIPAGHFDFDR